MKFNVVFFGVCMAASVSAGRLDFETGFRRVARQCVGLLSLIATVVVAAEQPGDALSPQEDSAAHKVCDPPSQNIGSRVIRVTPAGPRREDGSLAFVPGVCVYLPPGYDDGKLRYPVLYHTHGGGSQQKMIFADHLDNAYLENSDNAVIQVVPDGSGLAAWFDRFDNNNTSVQTAQKEEQGVAYGRTLNETYVLNWIIPYVDKHFRTIPTKAGRAIWGISNGGHGTMLLASKRPDLFVAAASMSGNVAWQSFTFSQEMIFDPETFQYSPAYRAGNLPANLASNLDGVDLIFDIATSCPPDPDDPWCFAYFAFESLFIQGNRDLQAALKVVGHIGLNDYRETEGGHNEKWWSQWFASRHLPFLLDKLSGPQPVSAPVAPVPQPDTFRYRSISYDFSIYGYEIHVERDVREFLDLLVDGDEIAVSGSGRAQVTTASRYVPGMEYRIIGLLDGTEPVVVKANDQGRLELDFDLGPSNQIEYEGHGDNNGFVSDPLAPAVGPTPTVTRLAIVSEIASVATSPVDNPVADVVPERRRSGGSADFVLLLGLLCLLAFRVRSGRGPAALDAARR